MCTRYVVHDMCNEKCRVLYASSVIGTGHVRAPPAAVVGLCHPRLNRKAGGIPPFDHCPTFSERRVARVSPHRQVAGTPPLHNVGLKNPYENIEQCRTPLGVPN